MKDQAVQCEGIGACSFGSLVSLNVFSMQALCVNDAVLRLGSLSRINDKCLELKQGKPKRHAAASVKQKPKVAMLQGFLTVQCAYAYLSLLSR